MVTRADSESAFSIGELAEQAGVAIGTLRMWELRYGFPSPTRLPSGHRRYGDADLASVRAVARARAEGLPLPLAIERAQRLLEPRRPSVYGALRERFLHLHPQLISKPTLRRVTEAIEDECCARARRPALLACFQRERYYRHVEDRWRALARAAEHAVVLADFPGGARLDSKPVELPLDDDDPMLREWVLVCEAPELSACLVGWERPAGSGASPRFEVVWTVEPAVVREAATVCCELIARSAPALVSTLRERLAERPPTPDADYLRATVELATRATLYAARERAIGP